jgi:predicted RNase H-like HicB family nuclease
MSEQGTEPGFEHRLSVKGYEVIVRATPGLVLITCPELPQLAVQGETLSAALTFAKTLIGANLAGRHAGTEEAR